MWKWFKLSFFFLKNIFLELFLQAGSEYRRVISKAKSFRLQDRTKEDFPPAVSRIYLGQTKLYLTYLVFQV